MSWNGLIPSTYVGCVYCFSADRFYKTFLNFLGDDYTNRHDDLAPPSNLTVSYDTSFPSQTIPAPPSYIELAEEEGEGFTTR